MDQNIQQKIDNWLSGNYEQSVKDAIIQLQKDNPEKTHPCFYNIIGDAYVHGIMDGEVFDMMSQNVCTLEDIVLV